MPRATIMVVDDQEIARIKLVDILEKNGFKVFSVNSGSQCIEMVKSDNKPDLIFLDIVMDEMDGFKTCRFLTKDDVSKDIPIIMVSSNNNKVDKLWAHKQGAKAFICKPYTEEEIFEHINRYL